MHVDLAAGERGAGEDERQDGGEPGEPGEGIHAPTAGERAVMGERFLR
jgi:hypothetical protein